jgi:hypothetical protein
MMHHHKYWKEVHVLFFSTGSVVCLDQRGTAECHLSCSMGSNQCTQWVTSCTFLQSYLQATYNKLIEFPHYKIA